MWLFLNYAVKPNYKEDTDRILITVLRVSLELLPALSYRVLNPQLPQTVPAPGTWTLLAGWFLRKLLCSFNSLFFPSYVLFIFLLILSQLKPDNMGRQDSVLRRHVKLIFQLGIIYCVLTPLNSPEALDPNNHVPR